MSRVVVGIAWFAGVSGATGDFYNSNDEHVSLLQTKVNSVRSQALDHYEAHESPLPSMSSAYYSSGYQGLCMLFKDAHVKSTFFRGNPRKDVDLADFDDFRVQGIFPLAKSSDGTLEAQGFNCPLANPRLHEPNSQRTALQSWALKVGDDVIEYYNNDYNTAPMDALQGLFKVNLADWKSAVDSVCPPGTGAKLSSWPDGKDWDYYAYERHKSVAYLKSDIWLRICERKDHVNDPCLEALKARISGGEPMLGVNGNPLPTNFLRDQVTGPIPGLPDATIRFHGKDSFQIFNTARDWVIMANFWDKAPLFGVNIHTGGGNWGWQQPMVTWNLRLAPNLKPVAPDDTLCGSTPPNNYPTTQLQGPDSLFSIPAQNAMCAWCNWLPSNANYPRTDGVTFAAMPSCVPQVAPPTPPPPPPVSELCEIEGISMEKAQKACESFKENSIFWRDCLVDYCASGGDPDTASEELHELAIDTTTTTPAPEPPTAPASAVDPEPPTAPASAVDPEPPTAPASAVDDTVDDDASAVGDPHMHTANNKDFDLSNSDLQHRHD